MYVLGGWSPRIPWSFPGRTAPVREYRVLPVGPTLYRMGLTFSVGLALFPTLIFGLEWLVRIVRAFL